MFEEEKYLIELGLAITEARENKGLSPDFITLNLQIL